MISNLDYGLSPQTKQQNEGKGSALGHNSQVQSPQSRLMNQTTSKIMGVPDTQLPGKVREGSGSSLKTNERTKNSRHLSDPRNVPDISYKAIQDFLVSGYDKSNAIS